MYIFFNKWDMRIFDMETPGIQGIPISKIYYTICFRLQLSLKRLWLQHEKLFRDSLSTLTADWMSKSTTNVRLSTEDDSNTIWFGQ